MADLPTKPVVPLGTKVKARTAGWEDIQADAYDASFEEGLDVLPAGEGVPEFVEGELEGFMVTETSPAYFKHIVDGYDVDASTITELTGSATIVASLLPRSDINRFADIDRDVRTKLFVAANDTMYRVLERAGAQIRTRMSRTASGRAWLSDRPCKNGVLARITPHALVAASGLNEQMLLQNALDDFQTLWQEYLDTANKSLLNQMAKVLNVDVNTMRAQAGFLEAGSQEGWQFLERSMTDLANGYLGDSASVVPTDEVVTTSLVDMNHIRDAISRAGGAGLQDPTSAGVYLDSDMSTMAAPQLSTGPIAQNTMRDGGLDIESYTWRHGFTPSPFPPHLALDGREFTSFTDPVLANSDSWPPNDYFMPGDHPGCECDFYINWRRS